jgi:hypothetical protein
MYQVLLAYGQKNLESFQSGTLGEDANVTGIEESLVGDYLKDMIRLTSYTYTTASTNYPDDPYFQEMALSGYMLKTQMTALIPFLKQEQISFAYASIEDGGVQRRIWEPLGTTKVARVMTLNSTFLNT